MGLKYGWRVFDVMISLAIIAFLVASLLPSGARGPSSPHILALNDLRSISFASLNVEAQTGRLPIEVENESGVVLSWATQILPMMDQSALYREIDQTSNWDSATNKTSYQHQVPGYEYPGQKRLVTSNPKYKDYGSIHYSANVHVLGPGGVTSSLDVTDGASNTMLFGSIRDNIPPWGQPGNFRDPALGLNRYPNGFGGPSDEHIPVSFVDGHVTMLSRGIDDELLKAIATPKGGENVEIEF